MSYDDISGPVVAILVLSIVGGIALMVILAGVVAGAITGGAIGLGYTGYWAYQKKKRGPYDAAGDASGSGLFGPGGIFLGEEVTWQ